MTSPSRAPIPWALAGFGAGGRIFHAPLIAAVPELALRAVVTRDPDRRAAAAAAYPGVRCVDDLAALAALGVAGVTISTPPATHVPLARAALELGLHVVVDKPVARSEAELATLVDRAEATGLVVAPYHNRRFDGDFRTLSALVADGVLGRPLHLHSRLDRARPVKQGWSRDAAAGGGLLLDLGPHLIDQAVALIGPVESVFAEMSCRRPGTGTEDEFTLLLRHASGAASTLSASLAAPAAGPRFLLQGTEAGARIEGFDVQEGQLKAGGSPGTDPDGFGVDAAARVAVTHADGSVFERRLERGDWPAFYRGVAAAALAEGPPPVPLEVALDVARVIDAARLAAETHRIVFLRDRPRACG